MHLLLSSLYEKSRRCYCPERVFEPCPAHPRQIFRGPLGAVQTVAALGVIIDWQT